MAALVNSGTPGDPSSAASTSVSRVNSGAATPPNDIEEEEVDQIESDVEDATSGTGGAVAGPGPSSLAHSQLAKGIKRAARGSPAPSPKKRRPRSSVARGLANYVPPPLPHYDVVRSKENSRENPHVIKIHDNVTDGSESRWPPEEERKPGYKVNNRLSWYECQAKDGGKHLLFREKLGTELARSLNVAHTNEGAAPEYWILHELPKGYLFTVHHCMTGNNTPRTDVYAFGSAATNKFRTPNELAPHLHWLLLHGPDDDLRCACKYCSKTKQGDVNRVLGLNIRSSSVASTSASIASPTIKRKLTTGSKASSTSTGIQAKVAAFRSPGGDKLLGDMTFKKKLKDGTTVEKKKHRSTSTDVEGSPPPTYKGAYTSRSRDSDLAYLAAPRQADLVYAELPKPFLSDDPKWAGAQITHWPAIVTSRVPYTIAKAVDLQPRSTGDEKKKEEGDEADEADVEDEDVEEEDEPLVRTSQAKSFRPAPKLEAKQEWRYNVRLLAVKDELRLLREDQLRPWLGNPPPSGLWTTERMTNRDAVKHVWDGKKTHRDCELLKDVKNLQEAVTAMALALQIAAHLVGAFSFNDRYEITEAHFNLATSEALDTNLAAVKAQQRKSWAFQSLHWGAELIWTGDFVRLIYPFGGHEESTALKPTDPDHRALFMRVLAIYKTNETVGDVERGTGMIGGEIWELRDFAAAKCAANGDASEAEPSGQNGTAGGPTNGAGVISPTALDGKQKSLSPSPNAADNLPPAPAGMYWYRLTAPSTGVHVTLDYLAGRYHPLPKSLNTQQKIKEALATLDAMDDSAQESDVQNGAEVAQTVDVALPSDQRMMLLAGLRPAQRLYMKCGAYKGTRHTAVVEAERNASNEVEQYFASMARLNAENADTSMEDDFA
ncbi:proteophosphoglycan ppg4 [Rhodotorula toruloides]|uniref:Proteophosphoglycan ppg4 n=1 Tax=Rhodotorula toruloides TaxID=5286 RepID=A0A511KA79_RHOTO|nr:proteophosphoglycan ppg4 [Rhodotorula toruloides]